MATSSFSKDFIIDDDEAIKTLINALEDPEPMFKSTIQVDTRENPEDVECLVENLLASVH